MVLPTFTPDELPTHLAIIMDGNGRWAAARNLSRNAGHRRGVRAVRRVVTFCRRIGIPILTLYAFSLENWNRPTREVNALMGLLRYYLRRELSTLMEKGIRLVAMGHLDMLPPAVLDTLSHTIEATRENDAMILNLAISYGGRAEIVDAVQAIARDVREGRFAPEDISEKTIASYLSTRDLPDPDLLIRTSGEMRLSNFFLWQTAYTEIYVTRTLWPDFEERDLIDALHDFRRRERRFGLTSEQVSTVPPSGPVPTR